ncbi:hypothetical protein [Microbulbifer aggregans]|uniref:hypothetical protein n=1 Tax=Microbulbifer aggregans TaxID=1769779 RepID=UPI0011AB4574|nr:hypothetical protein [Microbulbifer aggregans]
METTPNRKWMYQVGLILPIVSACLFVLAFLSGSQSVLRLHLVSFGYLPFLGLALAISYLCFSFIDKIRYTISGYRNLIAASLLVLLYGLWLWAVSKY